MSTSTYRAQSSIVTVAQVPLSGFGEDEFAKYTPNSESFGLSVGVDGDGSRFATGDKSGRMAITLAQTSASNDYLSELHDLDVNAPNGAGIGAFMLQDTSGRTKALALEAWIVGIPEVTLAKGINVRVWVFESALWTVKVAGN